MLLHVLGKGDESVAVRVHVVQHRIHHCDVVLLVSNRGAWTGFFTMVMRESLQNLGAVNVTIFVEIAHREIVEPSLFFGQLTHVNLVLQMLFDMPLIVDFLWAGELSITADAKD